MTKKVDFDKPLDTSVVKDRVAIVTGGANGIGLAIVTALAEAGAKVAIADFNDKAGHAAETELGGKGLSVKFFPVDTASWASQASLFKAVLAWSGDALDIVVPCAGVVATDLRASCGAKAHPPPADPPEPPTAALLVNLVGVYYTADLALFYFGRAAAAAAAARLAPQLLFISSLAGYAAIPMAADYSGAKFGVRAVWKSLRGAGAEFNGVQANLLAPTFIETAMIEGVSGVLKSRGIKLGVPEDAAAGAMRAICDPDVEGRAICIASGQGKAGSMNFDLEDDFEDHDGGKAMEWARKDGRLGNVWGMVGG